jgi:dienelactone hydrolase
VPKLSTVSLPLTLLALTSIVHAQPPPGITPEMIATALPVEGAPSAVPGSYAVASEVAFGSPGHIVFRPTDLSRFPARDTLPVVVWGDGGCAIDSTRYGDFLSTIASHGFLVLATAPKEGEPRRQATADDLAAAIDWAERENERAGSPLNGKIATDRVAVMGQSCGGFLSLTLGADPRVDTIGVFNSGVQRPAAGGPPSRSPPEGLAALHGPVLLVNGHERDFMLAASRETFDMLDHVPAFYGARHGAGHTATVFHPGGGEYANVAANWVKWQFKDDRQAGAMFVGEACALCTNPNWDVAVKRLSR